MYTQEDKWIITAEEASKRLGEIEGIRGVLDMLPKPDNSSVVPEKENLNQEYQGELFDTCIRVLANPKQVIHLHYNIADSVSSRSILATSDLLPGIWVSLAGTSNPYHISLRSEPEIKFLIGDILSTRTLQGSNVFGSDISTEAILTLMAILDQARRSWMISAINHLEPITLFKLEDIKERLKESEIEDFRWILPFTEKHLPFPIKEMEFIEDFKMEILELIETGLIEPVDEEATIFDLTEEGVFLTESDRQAASRLVLSHSFLLPREEKIAHDILTFTRGPLDLFIFLMSGGEGSFATLQPSELDIILTKILNLPNEIMEDDFKIDSDEILN